VKLGRFRLYHPILGEAAYVDKSAGDAAPYLSRRVYELLEFEPEFDCLPILPRIPPKKAASGEVAALDPQHEKQPRADRSTAMEDDSGKRAQL
jgi:hypothetical protein